jgi:hypothetical protein
MEVQLMINLFLIQDEPFYIRPLLEFLGCCWIWKTPRDEFVDAIELVLGVAHLELALEVLSQDGFGKY